MAEQTKIEWADHTWSPWIGCQKVGPGCDHCYAEALNKRAGGSNWGPGAPRRRTTKEYWRKPYRWNTHAPGTVFPSMCDPFDNAVDPAWRRDFAWVIRETPNLTWLLLTKRIGNVPDMLWDMFGADIPDNVRIGVTIVNQEEWDRDIRKVAQVAVLIGKTRIFLSMEPLLGGVDLSAPRHYDWRGIVGWIIAGGESGGGARYSHPDWYRSLRDQCAAAGVPFMMKQWGEWAPAPEIINAGGATFHQFDDGTWVQRIGKKAAGRLLDGVTHDGVPG